MKLLSDLKEPEALEFVEKALGKGADPMDFIGEAKEGMNIVGQRFTIGKYFIPDLFPVRSSGASSKCLSPISRKVKRLSAWERSLLGQWPAISMTFLWAYNNLYDRINTIVFFYQPHNNYKVIFFCNPFYL